MVCLRISVIYIRVVRVEVDPLKGNNGAAGVRRFLHPLILSLGEEVERGQMKEEAEIRSQPDAVEPNVAQFG